MKPDPLALRLAAGTLAILLVAGLSSTTALADNDDIKAQQIKADHKQVEGTWRIKELVVDGKKLRKDDFKDLTVVNESDGLWTLWHDGEAIARGTSQIDPTRDPKTIDMELTEGEGKGQVHRGIYDIAETTRRLCFAAPDKPRPEAFASKPGSQDILVVFERQSGDRKPR